jgi:hypothetical protein
MRELRATYLFDPEVTAAGWAIMRITAGYEGDVLIMSRERPWPTWGSGPVGPARHRVDRWCQGQVTSVTLAESSDRLHHAPQILPTDRWLVVKGRTKSEQDANARIYDTEGHMRHSFHAGDGIRDVQTTRDGRIWVSYFDEGVFGDLPLGEAGLVCFDSEGRLQFQYNSFAKERGLPPIDSCYALNVATTTDTWVYYCSRFLSLVHLRGTELAHHWTNIPVRGWNAFAAAEGRVLLRGGYKQHERLFLLSLDPTAAEEVNIVDDHGDAVLLKPTYDSCIGRAERFYIVADRGLFVVDLSELAFS